MKVFLLFGFVVFVLAVGCWIFDDDDWGKPME